MTWIAYFANTTEGVARMCDVAGHLHHRGFTITECDDRSLTIALDDPIEIFPFCRPQVIHLINL